MYTVENPSNIIMEDYRVDNFHANPPILHMKLHCTYANALKLHLKKRNLVPTQEGVPKL